MSDATPCPCPRCVAGRADRTSDLHEALQALVDVVDRIGGYMSPEDQRILWRARTLSGGAR